MNRKNFFSTIGITAVGYMIAKSFPKIPFVSKIFKNTPAAVSVKINPMAVKREKPGKENV
jgi:hypothetical protein